MAFTIQCPGCRKSYAISEAMAGKRVRCPLCSEIFTAPQAAEPVPPAPPRRGEDLQQEPNLLGPTTDYPVPPPAPPVRPVKKKKGRGSARRRTVEVLWGAFALPVVVVLLTGTGLAGHFWLPEGMPFTWARASRPPAPLPPVPAPRPAQVPVEKPARDPIVFVPPQGDLHDPGFEKPFVPPASVTVAIPDGDKSVVPLPGPVGDVVAGGGGRYLFLTLPAVRKIAVFDPEKAKVVRELPVAEEHVLLAAGASKLLVLLPAGGLLQCWDLGSFRREAVVPWPLPGVVKALSLGSASEGPVLVHGASGTDDLAPAFYSFLDLQTLKKREVTLKGSPPYTCYRDRVHFRASADGRVFGMWCTSHTPQGVGTLVLAGNEAQFWYDHTEVGHVVPDRDGTVLYTGQGRFTNQARRLPGEAVAHPRVPPFLVPARQGPFYLSVPRGVRGGALTLYLAGDDRPLVNLDHVDWELGNDPWVKHDLTDDKRVHFFPAAGLLVTLPLANDRLVLHRLDVEETLKKSDVDYLAFLSQPPPEVKKGTTYEYQPAVKARQGDVRFKVEAGPEGMEVGADGKLTWKVPAAFSEPECNVIVSARSAGGRECFQAFKIRITD